MNVVLKSASGRIKALCVFGVCGSVSVLLDAVDHPLALWLKGIPLSWENLATKAGRPLHLPAVLVSGCIWLFLCALHTRLSVRNS